MWARAIPYITHIITHSTLKKNSKHTINTV